MVSRLSRDFYDEARAGGTASARNFATRSLGVLIDKWTIVSGRPTAILGFAEVDAMRPGALALAQQLAASAREQTA